MTEAAAQPSPSAPTTFDGLYRESRERFTAVVASLSDSELATVVAGTPAWTVREVFAHITGIAADAAAGELSGIPDEARTVAQVSGRAERTTAEMTEELSAAGAQLEAALADRRMPLNPVQDMITHELDVRETLGLAVPDEDAWYPAMVALLSALAKERDGVLPWRKNVSGTLTIETAQRSWTFGSGEPQVHVAVAPYELYRALLSRRSRRQMLEWAWSGTGEPGGNADALPVFGPREDDQPTPILAI
ncbi:MAG: maleylpyruvate isomerase N-terminal domain-containing protein [Mycobacteriaceae bacterium]